MQFTDTVAVHIQYGLVMPYGDIELSQRSLLKLMACCLTTPSQVRHLAFLHLHRRSFGIFEQKLKTQLQPFIYIYTLGSRIAIPVRQLILTFFSHRYDAYSGQYVN